MTVPVLIKNKSQLICATAIDSSQQWQRRHHNQFMASYRTAKYLEDAVDLLDIGACTESCSISQLNIHLTRRICSYLGIQTPMIFSGDLNLSGTKTDRLIQMLNAVGGKTYLSGPSATAYLDKQKFKAAGIKLLYKSYDYEAYPQLWGAFEGEVTVLDLIANCGAGANGYLRSRSADIAVDP